MLARKLLMHATIVFGGVRALSMHRFWILRHGETDANAGGLIQGSSDFSRLTNKGKEQASLLAKTVKFAHVNSIYVSPLTRARETLDVLRDHNVHLSEEVVLDNLREIDLYAWEGRDKEYLKSTYPHSYNAWKLGDPHNFIVPSFSDQSERYPLLELWKRADEVWEEIKQREMIQAYPQQSSSSLLVAHGSLGQALLGTAMGWDATHFRTHEFPNCGLVQVDWHVCHDTFQFHEQAKRWRWKWPNSSNWRHAH